MKRKSGFSMLELMIVLVITAIIMRVAYPSYQTYVLRSHRSDGTTTLIAMQLAEEKYRFNNNSYGTLAQVWGGVTTSNQGYYTLTITSVTATGYVLTATGVGSQANDSESGSTCSPLTITVSNGTVTNAPSACWSQV